MAYLIYSKQEQHVTHQLDYDPREGVEDSQNDTTIVFEGEKIDTENDFITNYRLNAAGDGLENPYKSLSKADQLAKFQDDQAKIYAPKYQQHAVELIKFVTRSVLTGEYGETAWKVEKAKEVDLINGNNEAMKALAVEKQAIRDKGNAVEAEILALDPTVPADAKALIAYDVAKKMGQ
tara:strand:+ start:12293 stop:12826 length:534 start_codon:yes stop_codon:yes gene_type:complete